jgi:hypothetical protein
MNSFRRLVAPIIVLLALAATPAAQAEQPGTYYTINPPSLGMGTTDGFLTAGADGKVRTAVYRSGDRTQQWLPVYPEFPAIQNISGTTDFGCLIGLCGYNRPDAASVQKWLNRGTGKCLTAHAGTNAAHDVRVVSCSGSGTNMKEGLFSWNFSYPQIRSGVPATYTPMRHRIGSASGCITLNGLYMRPGTGLKVAKCVNRGTGVDQSFRFLAVATVS